MRKALTISAIALVSSMAFGGAATAFAADTPPAAPKTSSGPSPRADATGLKLSASTARPGDSVRFSTDVPDGSTNLSVSSKALGEVKMTDGRGGTAKAVKVEDGTYGVSLTGTGPDGRKIQATAELTVKADEPAPEPTPQASGVNLSTDFGRPGDKVVVTIKTSEKSAFVTSDAFGGQVGLKNAGNGTFTGTAIVAKDVKTGYYGVQAFAGGKRFDTVKFSTEGAGTTPDVKPLKPLKPLNPSEHKKPKGSVNTGQAPVGYLDSETSNG
ncbi:hypothetical protein ACFWBF_32895 [Streptomyces sp. NPDC060028]|uniref:hypothetical protein n=1 Tax=Streptomyces sp. NPDC060028 TaxID=3347041 RepID=UPI00369A6A2E